VAAMPFDQQDKTGISRQAAYNLILGVVQGLNQRRPAQRIQAVPAATNPPTTK